MVLDVTKVQNPDQLDELEEALDNELVEVGDTAIDLLECCELRGKFNTNIKDNIKENHRRQLYGHL